MYNMHSINFKTPKIKNTRRHRKKRNEFIGDLNKHLSEENTISREINELNMKIENIKKEVTHDMENLRKKKHETETQNTVEEHSRTRTSRRQNLCT
jgi:predicted  nucleic acid-binding Zn-ribbon protein